MRSGWRIRAFQAGSHWQRRSPPVAVGRIGEIMTFHFSRRAARASPSHLESAEALDRTPQHPLAATGLWDLGGAGEPRQFTYSKVLAWVAMDRAVKAVEDFGFEGDVQRWRQIRQQIHNEVCQRGFNRKLNAFVQSYGSQELDASLLIIPMVDSCPPTTHVSAALSR